jgi:exodeoxyribonuclease VII large subunit
LEQHKSESMSTLPLFLPQTIVLTVTELSALIRETLDTQLDGIWVAGEVSNLRLPPSGHCYFTLKDSKSQIAAVLFRSYASTQLFDLKNGIEVVCRGKVGLYAARGDLQIYVDVIEPRGLGALQVAFEQLKEKLSREGLFDVSHKRPLPFLPQAIGIITSLRGAAIQDILKVLEARFSNRRVVVRPVKVQGEKASEEIADAIREMGEFGGVDVLIVARGGGSMEDLWAFNEERVARAIFASAVPVVSAVGHEIDFTIADFVADVRAPTPTAAAQVVVPERVGLGSAVDQLGHRLDRAWSQNLQRHWRSLLELGKRLRDPEERLRENQMRSDELAWRLVHSLTWRLRDQRQLWGRWTERLCLHHPESWLKERASDLRRETQSLFVAVQSGLEHFRIKLEQIAGRLESLSPLAVLGRGYSIVRKNPEGWVVLRGSSLAKGDEVDITFGEGQARCRVESSQ